MALLPSALTSINPARSPRCFHASSLAPYNMFLHTTTACFMPLHVSFTLTHSLCFVNVVLAIHWLGLISPSSLAAYTYARGGKGGFEIYVDPSYVDPDIGGIVLVKTKPRVTMDGVLMREGDGGDHGCDDGGQE
ncbi:hypothetical protein CVT25_006169 [Psilocybe cyanescens]|uniref:Uncharacterized protein n=1 Tax=Psilocybe cyanescens TaxID=93625 RepID=A0A409XIL3_PSICY|nr:hypothetical protein CVT25_006169 [Psilocybe cyanescens]